MKKPPQIKRYLSPFVRDLALNHHKMAFISGPRQVGKTTCARSIGEDSGDDTLYKNWDDKNFRREWTKDPSGVIQNVDRPLLVIFDEIHKVKLWKRDLKGLYDLHGDKTKIIVTGSARLNIFKKGGDSLLGRYIPFRLHPFSLGELANRKAALNPQETMDLVFKSKSRSSKHRSMYEDLLLFGGFPSPYSRRSEQYLNIWHQERVEKLIREDLRDLSRIPDLGRLEMLAALLPERVGSLLSLAGLREDLEVAHNTVKNWMQYLEQLFYIYYVRPYSKGLKRSLKKEPKLFLWDWSEVENKGARFENMVASALLKSCDFWTDTGWGVHQLHFLRDKQKREVDFLLTQKGRPFLSIEAKLSTESLRLNFLPFCKALGVTKHIQIIHSPGIWHQKKIDGIDVIQASADLILQHFV